MRGYEDRRQVTTTFCRLNSNTSNPTFANQSMRLAIGIQSTFARQQMGQVAENQCSVNKHSRESLAQTLRRHRNMAAALLKPR